MTIRYKRALDMAGRRARSTEKKQTNKKRRRTGRGSFSPGTPRRPQLPPRNLLSIIISIIIVIICIIIIIFLIRSLIIIMIMILSEIIM